MEIGLLCYVAPCNETDAGTIAAGLSQLCSLALRSTVHF